MSKRSSTGDITNASHVCKPCGLSYNTEVQLMRHKDDRHGPQVFCTLCKTKTYVLPRKRTDVQRRHLIAKHNYTKEVTITQIRELFLPYFEECETPVFNHSIRSSVVVPSARAAPSRTQVSSPAAPTHSPSPAAPSQTPLSAAPSYPPVPAAPSYPPVPAAPSRIPAPSPSLPDQQAYPSPALPISTFETQLIDSTSVPDTLEAFLNEQSLTPEPLPSPEPHSTPELIYNTPSSASLPNLTLDWTFPNPQLAQPIRYEPLQDINIAPADLPTDTDHNNNNNNNTTSNSTPATPDFDQQTPTIPLETTQPDTPLYTAHRYPLPKPEDNVCYITGVDDQHVPEFPPRRLKVPARKAIDPRLLFRDAPSGFLAGSMARLAALQHKEITKAANEHNTTISFEHQNFTVSRIEKVQLLDGRMLTMKTSCTLEDNLKVSRGIQTQTEDI